MSHTPNQAQLRTLSNVERGAHGAAPSSTLLSNLKRAWFGVWDTDIIPQPVFSTTILGVLTLFMEYWFC